jgi:hypothetical protein
MSKIQQQNSFSHYVGRRVKNPVGVQTSYAVLMKRPPQKEVLQTSASVNENNYFGFRGPVPHANHILSPQFFGFLKPKRPFRRPHGPGMFTYSHPPTVITGQPGSPNSLPTPEQIQQEHQKVR